MGNNHKSNIKRLSEIPVENGKIVSVEFKEAFQKDILEGTGSPLPLMTRKIPDCYRVKIKLMPSEQSNIIVELWLPAEDAWNGKYLGTGTGGGAGQIVDLSLMCGAGRGYATANTDLGTGPDFNALHGQIERWKDFGHRATHLMTVVSKQIIEAFYGRAPEKSYFWGGSTGGNQALMEAQRYPNDHDGIVVMEPARNRTGLHTKIAWDWNAIHRRGALFNQQTADAITARIVEVYGKEAGNEEGDKFLAHPERIKLDMSIFDDMMASGVLTQAQVDALHDIYQGPIDPVTGEQYFPGMTPGSEAVDMGLVKLSDKESMEKELLFPFYWMLGEDYDLLKLDFHKDAVQLREQMGSLMNANDPDLSAFRDAGGKMLLISGTADPIISYRDATNYYQDVCEKMGGPEETEKFLRYFVVPGFGHTISGPCVQEVGTLGLEKFPLDPRHDIFALLEAWVEQGEPPVEFAPATCAGGSMLFDVSGEREAFRVR